MGDMRAMKRAYTELSALNNGLVAAHEARARNHTDLLDGLKQVNQMISKAASLRVGRAKEAIIKDCRQAVKANKILTLTQIMRIKKP